MSNLIKKRRLIIEIDTPLKFLKCIKRLRQHNIPVPITEKYEKELRVKDSNRLINSGYSCQGEHWEYWLDGYKGAGYYNRKNHNRTAQFAYNHIMCPPMLIWLPETVNVDKKVIKRAVKESLESEKYQQQCSIIRKHIPWEAIESKIIEIVNQ